MFDILKNLEIEPIFTSLKTAFVGIFFTFIIGILLVRFVSSLKNKTLKYFFDGILTLPLVLPPTVMGFFLLKIFGINSFIGKFFLKVFNYKIIFTWEATVIASVCLSIPLMYRTTLGAVEQVDKNIVYVARTLGFTERKIFWKILLPNSISGILSATILSFARGFGEYGATSMIAGNILGKTRTLPIAVATAVGSGNDEIAGVYTLIIVCISLILVFAMNYYTIKLFSKDRKNEY